LVRPNLQLPLAVAVFEEIFNGVQNSLAEYFLAAGGKVGILNSGRSIVLDLVRRAFGPLLFKVFFIASVPAVL
jgi:hypothetical protein